MKYETVLEAINSISKGTILRISYESNIELKAQYKNAGYYAKKITERDARIGINYDNMKNTIERRISGEIPSVNAGLSYGEWEVPGYIINNKNKKYLRFYSLNDSKVKTIYILNGKVVSKEEIEQISKKKSHNKSNTYNITTDNIIKIVNKKKVFM